MKLILSVDGASRGNPGPAAVGVVISDDSGSTVAEIGEYIGEATNNTAEYRALVRGLSEAVQMGATQAVVHADSQLVIKQMKGEYRVKNANLAVFYRQARQLAASIGQVTFIHIPRAENARADKLANKALDEWQNKSRPKSKKIEVKKTILQKPGLTLCELTIIPGQELAVSVSGTCFFYVLSGRGTALISCDKDQEITAADAVYVPEDQNIVLRAEAEPMALLAGYIGVFNSGAPDFTAP